MSMNPEADTRVWHGWAARSARRPQFLGDRARSV